MFADVNCRATIFAAECESLRETQADQNHRSNDAGGRVGGEQPDKERADAHQCHCDDERVFTANDVAEPSEEQRAKRSDGETSSEGKQREDESRRWIDAGKELRRKNWRQRAVDVKIVPLEHSAE